MRFLFTSTRFCLYLLTLQGGLVWAQNDQNLQITVMPGRVSQESIFGYEQTINVKKRGVVEKNLGGINCNIHVHGTVKGDISMIGGSLRIYKGGRVDGNIFIVGGTFDKNSDSIATGNLMMFLTPGEQPEGDWLSSFQSKSAFYFAQSLLLFLLVIITFYIFPNQVHEASFELSQEPVRNLIYGVVSTAVFVSILIVSFLLMSVLIGFPLLLISLCGFMVISLYGSVVIFYKLSQYVEDTFKVPTVFGILIGILLFGALAYIPLVRVILLAAYVVMGSGVVIATRFGTNKQWFTRKSRYWSAG